MKIITEKDLLAVDQKRKCQICKEIIEGKAVYIGSTTNVHKYNKRKEH